MAGRGHSRRKDEHVMDDEAERRAWTRRVGLIVALVALALFALPFVYRLLP